MVWKRVAGEYPDESHLGSITLDNKIQHVRGGLLCKNLASGQVPCT